VQPEDFVVPELASPAQSTSADARPVLAFDVFCIRTADLRRYLAEGYLKLHD